MNTKHFIAIDLHEAKQSIEDICVIGAACSELRKTDKSLNDKLESLNKYLQTIWEKTKNRHFTKPIED